MTVQNGYNYFVITKSNDSPSTYSYTMPTTVNSNTTSNYYGSPYYLSGNENTYTTVQPGQTINIVKHEDTAIIKMYKSNIEHRSAYNAEIILSNFPQST